MKLDCRQLERELTAVTEQRDGLRSGIDYASDELKEVTEQRDRLAEALGRFEGCYDCYECFGIAEQALQSLTPNNDR